MGSGLTFRLGPQRPPDWHARLERLQAWDHRGLPLPVGLQILADGFVVSTEGGRSGRITLPWPVADTDLVRRTTLLRPRSGPYRLAAELARACLADVSHLLPDAVVAAGRAATSLRMAFAASDDAEADRLAEESMAATVELGRDELHAACADRVAGGGPARPFTIPAAMIDPDQPLPPVDLRQGLSHVTVMVNWDRREPQPGVYRWEPLDEAVQRCSQAGLPVTLGPVLDFAPERLPAWLGELSGDPQRLHDALGGFLGACLKRYRQAVGSWEVTARTNRSGVAPLDAERMMWLTRRCVQIAAGANPVADLSVGIDRPFEDDLRQDGPRYSLRAFLDVLSRAELPLAAVAIEWRPGVPDGDWPRPLPSLARGLAHWSESGLPLRLRVGCPWQDTPDTLGHWAGGYTPATQARWFGEVALVCRAAGSVQHCGWTALADPLTGALPEGAADSPLWRTFAELAT